MSLSFELVNQRCCCVQRKVWSSFGRCSRYCFWEAQQLFCFFCVCKVRRCCLVGAHCCPLYPQVDLSAHTPGSWIFYALAAGPAANAMVYLAYVACWLAMLWHSCQHVAAASRVALQCRTCLQCTHMIQCNAALQRPPQAAVDEQLYYAARELYILSFGAFLAAMLCGLCGLPRLCKFVCKLSVQMGVVVRSARRLIPPCCPGYLPTVL